MTFPEARLLARTGRHIRRAAWEDKWFLVWRGVWWCQGAAFARPVLATDYTAADLLAGDWTTMPLALAGCPVNPAIGSTGGSVAAPSGAPPGLPSGAPGADVPGFSGSPAPFRPPTPGPGPLIIPTPGDASLVIEFSGMLARDQTGSRFRNVVPFTGRYTLPRVAQHTWAKLGVRNGEWEEYFPSSYWINLLWDMNVSKTLDGSVWKYDILVQPDFAFAVGAGSGGFLTGTTQPRLSWITNIYDSDYILYGGTARAL